MDITARALAPQASGFGTHTQLGLPPCLFLRLTGLPCPTCGMTTCFAHMIRGEFAAALHCHPLGAALFGALSITLPLALWAGVSKRPFFETLARMRFAHVVRVFAAALLAQWAARVACLLLG